MVPPHFIILTIPFPALIKMSFQTGFVVRLRGAG
jgi:hypothetical protein